MLHGTVEQSAEESAAGLDDLDEAVEAVEAVEAEVRFAVRTQLVGDTDTVAVSNPNPKETQLPSATLTLRRHSSRQTRVPVVCFPLTHFSYHHATRSCLFSSDSLLVPSCHPQLFALL